MRRLRASKLGLGIKSVDARRVGNDDDDDFKVIACWYSLSLVGFGLLSQLHRSFLDLAARRQGHSSARPEQTLPIPSGPEPAQLSWLQGHMRLRRKLTFEGKAERVWWDVVC